ncbi:MAG: hypothetical protein GVY05_02180 [Bacteroidetes bacterium]|nr:hypothetical protein [Bacteroidota bacterium]
MNPARLPVPPLEQIWTAKIEKNEILALEIKQKKPQKLEIIFYFCKP